MDLIELYAGKAGVVDEAIPPRILLEVINSRLRNFASETKVSETYSVANTVANQQEYELPRDIVGITKVMFDDYKAYHIRFEDVEDLTEEIS